MIGANMSAAAVFFIAGIMAENALLNICGWIFTTASLMLLIFMNVLRRRFAKLQAQSSQTSQ